MRKLFFLTFIFVLIACSYFLPTMCMTESDTTGVSKRTSPTVVWKFFYFLFGIVELGGLLYTTLNLINYFKDWVILYLITALAAQFVPSLDTHSLKYNYLNYLSTWNWVYQILGRSRPFVLLVSSGHLSIFLFMLSFDHALDVLGKLSSELIKKHRPYIYFAVGVILSFIYSYNSLKFIIYGSALTFLANFCVKQHWNRASNGKKKDEIHTIEPKK